MDIKRIQDSHTIDRTMEVIKQTLLCGQLVITTSL